MDVGFGEHEVEDHQVHGSGTLIKTLMEHGLADEYRLSIHPVVLGEGKRLFPDGTAPTALRLVDTKTTSRGVVVHVYQPSGKSQFGSVGLEQAGDVVRERPLSRTSRGTHGGPR